MNSSPIKGIRRKKSLLSEIKVLVVGGPSVGKSGQIFNFPIIISPCQSRICTSGMKWVICYNNLLLSSKFHMKWRGSQISVLSSLIAFPYIYYPTAAQSTRLPHTYRNTHSWHNKSYRERELSYTRSLSAAAQGSEFTIEHNRVRCWRFGFIHRSTSTFTLLMLNNNKSLWL